MTVCTHCGAPLPDLSDERQALIDAINSVNKQAVVPSIEADIFYNTEGWDQPVMNFRDIDPNSSTSLQVELPRKVPDHIFFQRIIIKIRPTYSARRGQ